MSSFREVQQKAKALGIKNTGRGVTKDYLLQKIAEIEGITVTKSSHSNSRTHTPSRKVEVETIDLIGADYTVFSGDHVFLDDEMKESLQSEILERFAEDSSLEFYSDGGELVAVQDERVLSIYKKALQTEKTGYKFYPGAICVKTAFPFEILEYLRGILPIGGLDLPVHISSIHEDATDIGIAVYTFDTYM